MKDISKHVPYNSVDEIYACHCLEHVSRHHIKSTLNEWYKILKPGGVMRLSVPDLEQAIKLYNQGTPLFPTLYGQFWGGQKDDTDYHTCGFDFKTLKSFIEECGFEELTRYDWKTFLPEGFDDYSRSYIPHMDFDNGTLISMNVYCRKRMPLIVYCTGGFTNAINSLIGAVSYAKKYHMHIKLYWIKGYTALDISFPDIFDVIDPTMISLIDDRELVELLKNNGPILKLTHMPNNEILSGVEGPRYNPTHVMDLPEPYNYNATLFYVSECPMYVQTNVKHHFDNFFNLVKFKDSIVSQADEYMASFPKQPSVGLHLRGTDILQTVRCTVADVVKFAMDTATSLTQDELPVLVCTDDRNIRDALETHPAFVFCDHQSYVTKCNDNVDWYFDAGTDHVNAPSFTKDGKTFKLYSSANVYRPFSQVIAGVIDLLLLAKMKHIGCFEPTSRISTYYTFAKMLQFYTSTSNKSV